MNRVVWQTLRSVTSNQVAADHGTNRAMNVLDRQALTHCLLDFEGRLGQFDELVAERALESVVLRLRTTPRHTRRNLRIMEDIAEIEAFGFPVRLRLHLQHVDAADHLVKGAEAELRHVLPYLF